MLTESGLEKKFAVVTGGSRGIGRACVLLLAKQGVDVTFFYQNSQQAALEVVDEAQQLGLKVQAFKADVRQKEEVAAAVEEVYQRTGRVDILINNSGIVRDNLLAAMSEQELKDVLDTNVTGVFNTTQAVVPFMMRQRQGCIINLSSVGAEKSGRGHSNYAASKGAINAFTKAMAVELAPRNIRVNAVAPGVIETDMSQQVRDLAGDEVLNKILLKRYGQAKDIAQAIVFLASDYASYITGEILHVDGGFKMA